MSIFGTDGVRARINTGPMTAENITRLALAAGRYFLDRASGADTKNKTAPFVVIGKDTRLSGYMVEAAMQAGFASIGMESALVGPLPTPGVAHLTRRMEAAMGVMISASHNPHYDNGIKIFGPDGYKLPDEAEAEITAIMEGHIALADAAAIGRGRRIHDGKEIYIAHLQAALSRVAGGMNLGGMRIVLDCAHGAAYRAAPDLLGGLGAEVIALNTAPDGFNINDGCGAVHADVMAKEVVAHNAAIGISLDGDADRVIMADEKGALIDGDQCLAVIADAMATAGRLRGNTIVGTLMTNHGLDMWLKGKGIALERAAVGDRYVLERMRTGGFNLGGEPSGHILATDFATSGDGLLAALLMLAEMQKADAPASHALRRFDALPQTMINIQCDDRARMRAALENKILVDAVAEAEAALGDNGRVVIRPSGTEPLLRVMVEASTAKSARAHAEAIAAVARGLVAG